MKLDSEQGFFGRLDLKKIYHRVGKFLSGRLPGVNSPLQPTLADDVFDALCYVIGKNGTINPIDDKTLNLDLHGVSIDNVVAALSVYDKRSTLIYAEIAYGNSEEEGPYIYVKVDGEMVRIFY